VVGVAVVGMAVEEETMASVCEGCRSL